MNAASFPEDALEKPWQPPCHGTRAKRGGQVVNLSENEGRAFPKMRKNVPSFLKVGKAREGFCTHSAPGGIQVSPHFVFSSTRCDDMLPFDRSDQATSRERSRRAAIDEQLKALTTADEFDSGRKAVKQ
jgi:hypothetical protein